MFDSRALKLGECIIVFKVWNTIVFDEFLNYRLTAFKSISESYDPENTTHDYDDFGSS